VADFQIAIEVVEKWEWAGREDGWPHSRDGDRGGFTRWGISQAANPGVDVENLSRDRALDDYWERYWKPIQGPSLLDSVLATSVMLAAVHMGPARATRELQECLPGVKADGKFGPLTLAATNAADGNQTLADFSLRVIRRYCEIALSDPTQERFLLGWTRRALDAACVL